jgi:hypothetical protein
VSYDALIGRLQAAARDIDALAPVPEAVLARVETALGFRLHELLRRFYLEVANGELFDIFSIATATVDPHRESSLLEVWRQMSDPAEAALLGRAVPFVVPDYMEWIWVDQDGALFSSLHEGLYRAPATFEEWLHASLAGGGDKLLFAEGEPRLGKNPFTGQPWIFRQRTTRGELLIEWPD